MADTYDVYFGEVSGSLSLLSFGQEEVSFELPFSLDYLTIYYWRVDVYDGEFLTTGDEWSFTTMPFLYPRPSGIAQDGSGVANGLNNMTTIRRLVAVAANKVYYET